MKKYLLLLICLILTITCTCGCSFDEIEQDIKKDKKEEMNKKVPCIVENQYADEYGFSYYIEGTCTNNSSKDYDYLQVEFICYDAVGNNVGTALDNMNNLLIGQTWKFKAMDMGSEVETIDHCDLHEVSGW